MNISTISKFQLYVVPLYKGVMITDRGSVSQYVHSMMGASFDPQYFAAKFEEIAEAVSCNIKMTPSLRLYISHPTHGDAEKFQSMAESLCEYFENVAISQGRIDPPMGQFELL